MRVLRVPSSTSSSAEVLFQCDLSEGATLRGMVSPLQDGKWKLEVLDPGDYGLFEGVVISGAVVDAGQRLSIEAGVPFDAPKENVNVGLTLGTAAMYTGPGEDPGTSMTIPCEGGNAKWNKEVVDRVAKQGEKALDPRITVGKNGGYDIIKQRDETAKSDKERGVRMLSESERVEYRTGILGGKIVYLNSKKNIDTNAKEFAIYVLDPSGRLYVSTEHEEGKFHHSTFLAGGPVAAAGQIGLVHQASRFYQNLKIRSGSMAKAFLAASFRQAWNLAAEPVHQIS